MSRSAVKDGSDGSARAAARHDEDLYTWVQEQVALLRARRLEEIDAENIAEELSDAGRSELAKLESALRVLVMHMLKRDQQPEPRTPGWVFSIREQRRRLDRLFRHNPGLKPHRDEALAEIYHGARDWASLETHFDMSEFPSECPYTWDDLLSRPFETDPKR